MRIKSIYRFLPLFITVLLLSSCATADFSTVNASVVKGNYRDARNIVEAQKKSLYTENDKVLYNLDVGILSHYSGEWNQSNEKLTSAERLIEEYYSKSISQGVTSYFVNDMVVDYAGEDYEDIYTNFFMALNYIQLGKLEDAMVEIRRFDNKQKLLSTKYESQLEYADSELGSNYANTSIQFQNSAAARYLSMLLYRANGQLDSAEVDRKLLIKAFNDQPAIYNFDVPLCIDDELSVPKGKARLNFVCFTGQAPIKVEDVSRIEITDTMYCKIAVPMMVDRGSTVSSISVNVYDASGNPVKATESVSNSLVTEVPPEESIESKTSAEIARDLVTAETDSSTKESTSSRSSAARARALAMGINSDSSNDSKNTKNTSSSRSSTYPRATTTRSAGIGGSSSSQQIEAIQGKDSLYSTLLEKIESVENIATDTFGQHANVIFSRAMIRAIGKTLKTGALSLVSSLTDDPSVSQFFSILSFASQVADEITEQADLRTSRFFPANIYVGGITLDPGVYTVVVSFNGNGGQVMSTKTYENVKVTAKSVNIVEAICSK